jgi:hypothetical protein
VKKRRRKGKKIRRKKSSRDIFEEDIGEGSDEQRRY